MGKWNWQFANALFRHNEKEADMFTDMLVPLFLWWTMIALV
jgi:hypothetical protein